MDKKIEKMAKDIYAIEESTPMCETWNCNGCGYEKYKQGYYCDFIKRAEKLFDKGYRKQSETVREILERLKFLYAERQKEYTNWDGNKIKAVTTEWLNADIECIAKEYGIKID